MRKRTLGNAQPLLRPWELGARGHGVPVVPLTAIVAVHVGKVVVRHGVTQPRRVQVENLRRPEALHTPLCPPIAGHRLVVVVCTRAQSHLPIRVILGVVAIDAPATSPAVLRLHQLLRDPYQWKAGFRVGSATRYLLGPHPAKHWRVGGSAVAVVAMPLSHRATLPSPSSTSRRPSRPC